MMDSVWNILTRSSVGQISKDQWDAVVSILVDKPQSVDKRVAGQIELTIDDTYTDKTGKLYDQLVDKSVEYTTNIDSEYDIIVQKLVSKNSKKYCDWYRVVIIQQFSVCFLPFNLKVGSGTSDENDSFSVVECVTNIEKDNTTETNNEHDKSTVVTTEKDLKVSAKVEANGDTKADYLTENKNDNANAFKKDMDVDDKENHLNKNAVTVTKDASSVAYTLVLPSCRGR
jgi:hypothetical protein